MKQYIYSILSFLLLVTSCGKDDMPDSSQPDVSSCDGVYATMQPLSIQGDAEEIFTRSALAYSNGKMNFTWTTGDAIGVVNGSQLQFTLSEGSNTTTGKFAPPSGVTALTGNTEYIAYSPYQNKDITTSIQLNYTGQTATENAKKSLIGDSYIASEAAASAHLSAYDYLVSRSTMTNDGGNVNFTLNRLGAIVRFYVMCPAEEVFESLSVGCNEAVFLTSADLSLSDRTISNATYSKSITLQWNVGGSKGLDMSKSDYYKNGIGYIIAYMMVYPVDLSNRSDLYLYLVSHDTDGTKHYWKSNEPLSKLNLKANNLYQWTVRNSVDFTTTLVPITSTEYFTGTGLTDGGTFGDNDWE